MATTANELQPIGFLIFLNLVQENPRHLHNQITNNQISQDDDDDDDDDNNNNNNNKLKTN